MPSDTRELEKELLAGLEGLPEGPWEYASYGIVCYSHANPARGGDHEFLAATIRHDADEDEVDYAAAEATAQHFARCSPDNIRALLSTIADLRATVAEAVRVMEPAKADLEDWIAAFTFDEAGGDFIESRDIVRELSAFTAKHGGSNAE